MFRILMILAAVVTLVAVVGSFVLNLFAAVAAALGV